MSAARPWTLEVDGASATLVVTRVRGDEKIHAPSRFDVTVVPGGEIELAKLVGQRGRLVWALPGNEERVIEGYVDAVDTLGTGLRIAIVPKLALLADTVDYQVFVDLDAVAIVEEVLSEHGISVDRRISRTPEVRAQTVQSFESDLAFVSRLLAEEGITFFIPEGAIDRVVIGDDDSGWATTPGASTLPVRELGGLDEAGESVFDARVRRTRVHDKVTLRDYDFEKPLLDQTATADRGGETLELYDYPGGYVDPGIGTTLAGLRLDALRGRKVMLTAKTSSRRLAAGHVIELEDARREDVTGTWLVVEVHHDGVDGLDPNERAYVARFVAVPADAAFRATAPVAPRPGGVETVTVTGPGGAEIHSEALGRAKLQLRWDRRRPKDDTASSFMRVAQPATSGGFMFPRVGWENVAVFRHPTGDAPWLLGRLYNGQTLPPSGLPGKKVVSALGTMTSPGGGGGNLIEMDDSAGAEAMNLHASKNFDERTENDKNSSVTANDAWTVGAARKLIVGQVLSTTIGASQTYSVAANRKVNVGSDKFINAASETVIVGGLRTFDVGGDHKMSCSTLTRLVGGAKVETAIEHVNRAVKGASTVLVGGTWRAVAGASHNVSVSGASTDLVSGAKSIKSSKLHVKVRGVYNETLGPRTVKAGGDREEGFGGAASYTIGAAATFKASEITVKATSQITLKGGGATVTITSSCVDISGDYKSSTASADDGDESYGD